MLSFRSALSHVKPSASSWAKALASQQVCIIEMIDQLIIIMFGFDNG